MMERYNHPLVGARSVSVHAESEAIRVGGGARQ